jgi:hypothetical protein
MSVWILVIMLYSNGSDTVHTIDGFPTEKSCEVARVKVQGDRPELYQHTVCIELPWEDSAL